MNGLISWEDFYSFEISVQSVANDLPSVWSLLTLLTLFWFLFCFIHICSAILVPVQWTMITSRKSSVEGEVSFD